jgi:hypothetical protein
MGKKFKECWSTNPPNINKTNNYLSPLITEHEKDHMPMKIQAIVWDTCKNGGGEDKPVIGISTLPSW